MDATHITTGMSLLSHSARASKGVIQVIFGPMFSGKTTELLRRMKRFSVAKHKCLLVKYGLDTRYSVDAVSTHDRQTSAATSCQRLDEIEASALAYSVIGIDEGQFFPDLVPFCESMANRGKTVIVAALDGTFQRKAFGEVLSLVPLAESVVKLNAVCMYCCADAAFSKRVSAETEVEVIGGEDKYVAVCRECFAAPPPPPPPAASSTSSESQAAVTPLTPEPASAPAAPAAAPVFSKPLPSNALQRVLFDVDVGAK